MPDHIRYDLLTQQALRGVVRQVLIDTAKKGLVGEHHFYISFDTRADGVRLSERLKQQYSEQMTIILQHQFWDLSVSDTGFEVGLSFGGIPEKLGIPFDAVKGFFDPSVQFGLQFEDITAGEAQGAQTNAPTSPPDQAKAADSAGKSAARPPAEHKRAPPTLAAVPTPANPEPAAAKANASKSNATEPDDGPDKPTGSGEVVRLDRFRKK